MVPYTFITSERPTTRVLEYKEYKSSASKIAPDSSKSVDGTQEGKVK